MKSMSVINALESIAQCEKLNAVVEKYDNKTKRVNEVLRDVSLFEQKGKRADFIYRTLGSFSGLLAFLFLFSCLDSHL